MFYDEEARQVQEQVELETSCINRMNDRSLAEARALAESRMPADHLGGLVWYYIRMLCRQIIRVIEPKMLWEFEASDYDVKTFERVLQMYGGGHNH